MTGKIYTYEEYLKENDISDEERFEICEVCGGDGTHTCDCGNEHDCDECHGEGRIDTEWIEYERKKEEQTKKYEFWQQLAGIK